MCHSCYPPYYPASNHDLHMVTLSFFVMSTGDNRGHHCPICGLTYSHRRTLSTHMKSHEGQASCGICGQQFSMTQNMRRHMMLKHNMSRQEVDRMTDNRLGRHALQDMAQHTAGVAAEEIVSPPFPPSRGPHYSGDH